MFVNSKIHREALVLGEAWTPSEYYSQIEYVHPQVAFLQR